MFRMPPRQAIYDRFEGVVLKVNESCVLSTHPHDSATTLHRGGFIVRYGIVYLGQSTMSIIPELVALDSGGGYSGEEAWDFLFNKSNLFPRADVIGFRDDGQEDMVTVKNLDLMFPVRLWVYPDETTKTPIAQALAIITSDVQQIAPRLTQLSTTYSTLEDWQKTL